MVQNPPSSRNNYVTISPIATILISLTLLFGYGEAMADYLLSIDVGTRSLRAALVSVTGGIIGQSVMPLVIHRPEAQRAEQSSQNIWEQLINAVRHVLADNPGVSPGQVLGIGFDSTYSMLFLDQEHRPLPLSQTQTQAFDVLLWCDHRAMAEADQINRLNPASSASKSGGRVTAEMPVSRCYWMSQHRPTCWQATAHIIELFDFLVLKATGELIRSPCSFSTRARYLATEDMGIGIYDRTEGPDLPHGAAVGEGLLADVASQMGLLPGTPVSTGTVDGYAGTLAVMGAGLEGKTPADYERGLTSRISMVVGTSSIYQCFSSQTDTMPGIWGPWDNGDLAGLNAYTCGQNALGALLDHLPCRHPAAAEVSDLANQAGVSVYDYLESRLTALAKGQPIAELTRSLHILPFFAGNRCPIGDCHLTGMISGLGMDSGPDDMALLYLATIQALALEARHALECLLQAGLPLETLMPAGGLTRNRLFMQEHVNVLGMPAILNREQNPMPLGAAMMAAVAAGVYPDIRSAIAGMSRVGETLVPESGLRAFYDKKYRVYREMHQDQVKYATVMDEEN
ncbi:FGGY-family carbohydrate kinase [Kistimonas scapharcae]|uniref:FGGY-family carbohydrate kinase n=1 Tax=Kistimonas scapharcae TaxID=1036133 RepID=A0ABP8V5P5_9GAMM